MIRKNSDSCVMLMLTSTDVNITRSLAHEGFSYSTDLLNAQKGLESQGMYVLCTYVQYRLHVYLQFMERRKPRLIPT